MNGRNKDQMSPNPNEPHPTWHGWCGRREFEQELDDIDVMVRAAKRRMDNPITFTAFTDAPFDTRSRTQSRYALAHAARSGVSRSSSALASLPTCSFSTDKASYLAAKNPT
ncbi:hypothetical protein H257_15424 [Aphanomyces astaci]|uniref:Uncharacterized protein n=1 Tax=Aphanomyces astaci TaxID=112090 RepID=W4FP76_APHAT|nr:hypothetical protein H257_15424 [Aphanomyces astaci]ETV68614.1 hypothetical protein H257_15424 [Aphanomyces astaci]|eukprot:XP_009841839.1 hypothetical protein H257_15424 [Aphanomyces astaci]